MEEIMVDQPEKHTQKQKIYPANDEESFRPHVTNTLSLEILDCPEHTFDPEPGAKIRNYVLVSEIGRGAGGVVYKVWEPNTRKFFAMKVIERQECQIIGMDDGLPNEVALLTSVSHPHIIRTHECINTTTHTLLIMDLAVNGTLVDLCERGAMDERRAHAYLHPIMHAVDYLHKKCIQHLDIKLDNILINSSENTLLSDFGASVRVMQRGEKVCASNGTSGYLAPEVLNNTTYCGEKADAFSLGVCVYGLVHGFFPKWNSEKELVLHDEISVMLHDFLTRALRAEPTMRLSVSEMLEHPWVKLLKSRHGAVVIQVPGVPQIVLVK